MKGQPLKESQSPVGVHLPSIGLSRTLGTTAVGPLNYSHSITDSLVVGGIGSSKIVMTLCGMTRAEMTHRTVLLKAARALPV